VLRALLELRADYPDTRYVLVGSISPNYDVRGLVERLGLGDAVQITGFVSRRVFEDYVAAADICLNLRYPSGGETSASLLRLLGAGRPTLVSATGAFAELPAGVAAQVDPDASEGDLILAYCRLLASRPDLAAAMGAQARAYVASEHSLERAAQGYMAFLSDMYGWGTVQRVRDEPLWDVRRSEDYPPPETPPLPQPVTTLPALPALPAAADAALPAVAEALVEMGVHERDEALLRSVAERLAGLENDE
jgi:hypothetical protein